MTINYARIEEIRNQVSNEKFYLSNLPEEAIRDLLSEIDVLNKENKKLQSRGDRCFRELGSRNGSIDLLQSIEKSSQVRIVELEEHEKEMIEFIEQKELKAAEGEVEWTEREKMVVSQILGTHGAAGHAECEFCDIAMKIKKVMGI